MLNHSILQSGISANVAETILLLLLELPISHLDTLSHIVENTKQVKIQSQ